MYVTYSDFQKCTSEFSVQHTMGAKQNKNKLNKQDLFDWSAWKQMAEVLWMLVEMSLLNVQVYIARAHCT